MNVTTILKDSSSFFLSNIKQITLLCLPILLFGTILDRALVLHYEKLLGMGVTTFASLILWLLIYPIYTGALILLITKRTHQEYPHYKDLILASLKIWYPLFLVSTFSTCMFLFGLMLFVLPGIWILVRLSFSEMFLVVRGLSPMEAIRQSYICTQQHFWILLVFFMPFLIIHFVLDSA